MGYEAYPNSEIYHTFFDFRGDTLNIDSMLVPGSLYMSYTNASICDTAGNLLLFSNGCGVMDADFQYVPGAGQINETTLQSYLCNEVGGGRRPDAMLILPDDDGSSYHLIHTRLTDIPVLVSDRLLWSKLYQDVDGKLSSEFLDSTIIEQFLFSGNLSACRHANGLDWWVVSPKNLENIYYMVRMNSSNYSIHADTIGLPTDEYDDSTGEAVFSPDGTKYARYTIHADLQIFDFNRCTGQFGHPIHVPIVDAADTSYSAGVAFSPSGQYLYVSSTRQIYQFDMQAADIPASKTTVATYDGFFYPIPQLPTRFYQCELGPDGKIYISCPGGKRVLHVIEHPDSAGLACQVVQHKYILDYPIFGGLPHFPNFRLGALPGGACPSVSAVGVGEQPEGIKVYPNPASSALYVQWPGKENPYRIINLYGQTIQIGRLVEGVNTLDLQSITAGVYFLVVGNGEWAKFVITH